MSGLLIIFALFAVLWFVMIRPQRIKAQQQARMLNAVEIGDEVLTVGGIYGIVQELEPDEDGGDLIVEIAEGIHVRVARKALATVVKPEDEDEDEDDEDEELDDADVDEEAVALADGVDEQEGEEEVNDEGETVNPGAADEAARPERS